jgi:DNA (cytosine-5)-methyltransferase 1
VTVGVSAWLGRRLADPGDFDRQTGTVLLAPHRWPTAAWGQQGKRWAAAVSMWPEQQPYQHLLDLADPDSLTPLSRRAVDGFHRRMERSTLRFDERFRLAVKEHLLAARQAE